jgi:hypothetical protein
MRRTISLFLVTMLAVSSLLLVSSMAATAGSKEGCTPGYWKQSHHFDDWTGYSPSDKFGDVFPGINSNPFPTKTLLQVLRTGGGGMYALGRHSVATLLNAANPNVAWGASAADAKSYITSGWNGASTKRAKNIFKNELERTNQSGCPL